MTEKKKHVIVSLDTHTKLKTLTGAWKRNFGDVIKELLKDIDFEAILEKVKNG